MCIAADVSGVAALHDLRAALPAGARGVFSHPRYLEVTAAGVDKAHAVRAACAALGIPLDAVAAIGDQENDIGMLRAVGIGIAMGNAHRRGPPSPTASRRATRATASPARSPSCSPPAGGTRRPLLPTPPEPTIPAKSAYGVIIA